jgi:hypothetical protein
MDHLPKLREQIIRANNSDEFKQLSRYYKKKSFFNILGISRKENIHSYFLHWLFSANESHEMGDFALRRLLELIVLVKNKLQSDNPKMQFPEDIEDVIICGGFTLDHIVCERERAATGSDRLDLFLSFDLYGNHMSRHLNIILENKVKSKEGKEQTARYYRYGESLEGEAVYLFLSPLPNSDFEALNQPACECKRFIGLNYQYLVDYVLEPCLSGCGAADAKVFIEEYLRTLSQPSLQFEDYDGGEIIMAVSTKERELLLQFWENNKELLTAALNALADNPELEQEERDQIRDSLGAVTKAGNKDYSTYAFNGQSYGKGRLVLAVVKKCIEDNPDITYERLKTAFADDKQKVIATVADANGILRQTGYKRHFLDAPIQLADEEIVVSSEWGSGNIGGFIRIAESHGYSITLLSQTEEASKK